MFDQLLGPKSAVPAQGRYRFMGRLAMAGAIALTQVAPAFATIDNVATSQGSTTPAGAVGPYGSAPIVKVPVQTAAPSLSVSKTLKTAATQTHVINGTNTTMGGDTIVYQYVVTNTGNVTINNVTPVDAGPKFNGIAASGAALVFSPASASLAPGASQTYTATYTLTNQDVFEAAGAGAVVINSATATGTPASGTLALVTPSIVTTSITGAPNLCISKTAAWTGAPATPVVLNQVVTYTYAVQNCGNVTMYNVQVVDQHGTAGVDLITVNTAAGAGNINGGTLTTSSATGATASSTSAAANATWPVLGAGAVVTFTWSHAVTQAELDHG